MTDGSTVLVTGAGGLVGGAVCVALQAAGSKFVAVSRRPLGAYPDGQVIDLASQSLPDRQRGPLAAIVHCAAPVPTNPAYPDTAQSAALLRAIDANVFATAQATGAAVVYLSSCGLYDPRDPKVKSEDAPVEARTPYFEAKLDGEQRFASLPRSLTIRLSAPVGRDIQPNLVLPRFITAALAGRPLTIWGSGSREQDFVGVAEVAGFVEAALRLGATGLFNIASGAPWTMRQVAEIVVATVGTGHVTSSDNADPLDGETARYSTYRARVQVGWVARAGLETLVRELAADLRSRA